MDVNSRLQPAQLDMSPRAYVALNELITIIQESQIALDVDVEDLVIFLTVLTGNLQRWHRSTQQAVRPEDGQLEIELVPMSQSAVARATGMARQTVGRRLRDLSNRAIVMLDENAAATANPNFVDQLLELPPLRRLRQVASHSEATSVPSGIETGQVGAPGATS
jgi:hypothetical protein